MKYLDNDKYGKFKYNPEYDWYESLLKFQGIGIDVYICNNKRSDFSNEFLTLDILFKDQAKWMEKVVTFYVKDLLELKNDTWLQEDEEIFTKSDIIERTKLKSLRIYRDSGFEFGFDENEIFNSCDFVVEGSLKEGPTHVFISF